MQIKRLHILLLLLGIANCLQAQLNERVFNSSVVGKERDSLLYGYNRFKNKLPFAVADSIVTFFLRGNKEAKKVSLSGSFCNWDPKATPMTRTDSGWIAIAKLIAGKHLYKFIIDGNWSTDEDNLLTEKDDQGNINSVYYKTNIVFTLKGISKAKKVWLAASFNNWSASELSLSKTASGWEIPLYLSDGTYGYKFKVDNEWHEDLENHNGLPDMSGGFSSLLTIGKPVLIKNLGYYQNELAIHERYGTRLNIIDDLGNLGNSYLKMHDYANAIRCFQRVIILYEELKDHSGIADMLMNIADAYRDLSDFPHLLEYLQKANREYEKAGNLTGLAKVLQNTAYYYVELSDLPTALDFSLKAFELYERLNKQMEKATVLGDIGHTYLLLGDDSKAFLYLQNALSLNQQIGNKIGEANNLWPLGHYYFKKSNVPAALDYFKKAQNLFEEMGDKVKVGYIYFSLADLYRDASDSALAAVDSNISQRHFRSIEYYKKGLDILKNLRPESEHIIILLVLSEAYERIKKFDSAHHYFKQYIVLRDKFFGTEKQKDIVRLESRYEFEKKEDSLKLQQELTDEKLQKQLLLARQQQQKLELNQVELALTNKEKDLQHLAYLKMQADLQNEQLVKQQKEKENQLQTAQVKTLTQEKAIIKLNQQRQWIYIIGAFVLLGLGSLYFIYHSRLRGVKLKAQLIKEKADQEKKETEFQHKLADVSMAALRSQMNPHFIFNCLNSIKLYTTQNDSAAASEYLTKFSKLIRLILENSRNERITLSSELAALQLYVEMEAMRFKEKLSYSFSVEKNVESDYIEIPPLLLQPYVENAIWHGLMHREEGGHISITIALQEESILEINIADNGIGRKAATILRDKVAGKHRSYGMKATTERIALINQIYKTGASVVVHDLIDEKGQASGTRVCIQIPV